MTRQLYQETMSKIQATEEYKAKLKRELAFNDGRKRKCGGAGRYIPFIAAAVCLVAAAAAVFIFAPWSGGQKPATSRNVAVANSAETAAPSEPLPFGDVKAFASSPGDHAAALALPCGSLSAAAAASGFPSSATDLPVVTFREQDGSQYIDSVSGIDLVVSGEDIDSVTYGSKNYDMFYEDSRNWKTTSGDLTWSEYNLFLTTEQVGTENPTQSDIIKALGRMQFSDNPMEKLDIKEFLSGVYAQELADIEKRKGDIDAFMDEKMAQPIDFLQYQVEYNYEDFAEKSAALASMGIPDKSGYTVTITNPANPPVAPAESKSVTVRPGEYVTWLFDTDTISELIGKEKTKGFLSGYSDEISVTVTSKSGVTRTQKWNISFTDAGNVVVSGGEDDAKNA